MKHRHWSAQAKSVLHTSTLPEGDQAGKIVALHPDELDDPDELDQ